MRADLDANSQLQECRRAAQALRPRHIQRAKDQPVLCDAFAALLAGNLPSRHHSGIASRWSATWKLPAACYCKALPARADPSGLPLAADTGVALPSALRAYFLNQLII